MFRSIFFVPSCGILIGCLVQAADPQTAITNVNPPITKVELKVVKYRELSAAIRSLRGQVVVVDLWADWCIPCKLAFPHLVAMQKDFVKDGLVCVSVSLDEVKEKDKALAFLHKQDAKFPNYLLDEESGVWQEKFEINGLPALFVFDRQNRLARKFDNNDPNKSYTHEDVRKLVQELLKK